MKELANCYLVTQSGFIFIIADDYRHSLIDATYGWPSPITCPTAPIYGRGMIGSVQLKSLKRLRSPFPKLLCAPLYRRIFTFHDHHFPSCHSGSPLRNCNLANFYNDQLCAPIHGQNFYPYPAIYPWNSYVYSAGYERTLILARLLMYEIMVARK